MQTSLRVEGIHASYIVIHTEQRTRRPRLMKNCFRSTRDAIGKTGKTTLSEKITKQPKTREKTQIKITAHQPQSLNEKGRQSPVLGRRGADRRLTRSRQGTNGHQHGSELPAASMKTGHRNNLKPSGSIPQCVLAAMRDLCTKRHTSGGPEQAGSLQLKNRNSRMFL